MKIGIIGGGSIGILFAYYLHKHHSVCLYVRTKEQADSIHANGLFLGRGRERRRINVDVKLVSEWIGNEEATFIAVKQYHLSALMEQLNAFCEPGKILVFLQNGMGHIKFIKQLSGDVLVGTVEHGALKTSSHEVVHTGIGLTKLASVTPFTTDLEGFFNRIHVEEFPFHLEKDYEQMLLKKLVVNAVINPLTSILQVKNGELIDNPHFFSLVKQMFVEIQTVLQLKNHDEYFHNVLAVCEKTAHNQSSMLRDIMENRPTEIDAILGFILEKAAERKINTPIVQSFYLAVKGKEYRVEEHKT